MDRREAIKAVLALPAVASVQIANVEPDDVIVLKVDRELLPDHYRLLRQHVQAIWPGREVAVLAPGMTLELYRPK